jgi:hypothetical protein
MFCRVVIILEESDDLSSGFNAIKDRRTFTPQSYTMVSDSKLSLNSCNMPELRQFQSVLLEMITALVISELMLMRHRVAHLPISFRQRYPAR